MVLIRRLKSGCDFRRVHFDIMRLRQVVRHRVLTPAEKEHSFTGSNPVASVTKPVVYQA